MFFILISRCRGQHLAHSTDAAAGALCGRVGSVYTGFVPEHQKTVQVCGACVCVCVREVRVCVRVSDPKNPKTCIRKKPAY